MAASGISCCASAVAEATGSLEGEQLRADLPLRLDELMLGAEVKVVTPPGSLPAPPGSVVEGLKALLSCERLPEAPHPEAKPSEPVPLGDERVGSDLVGQELVG